ncbi:hypothetical protein GGF32_005399 [Allomyces javanicus]|nr:hypothetical protein GGF32_005399 [Allomyces javanicus]
MPLLDEVTARLEALDLDQTVDVLQSMRAICSPPDPIALNVSHRRAVLLVELKTILDGMRSNETAGPGV